jgi:maltokinase
MSDGTSAGASAAVVRRLVESYDGPGDERQVSTDQANLSISVDERVLVKWLRDPVSPDDVSTLQCLRSAGFPHMPAFFGALVEGGAVLALLHEMVEGATDGWQWYVDDVVAWIDGSLPLEPLVETAARMGAITAELHRALAPDGPVERSLDGTRDRIAQLARSAFSEIDGAPAERLHARRAQIERAIAPLAVIDRALVQRVHGDLHAGQFLRAGDRLLLTDFDGDPMVASDARLAMQPVERDLAGLVQSLDHVARVAGKRRPDAAVEPFIAAAIDACLDAYRARHAVDDRLLWPLRVAQELHEYTYAATRLPVWLYVPDAAIARLFP